MDTLKVLVYKIFLKIFIKKKKNKTKQKQKPIFQL